MNKLQNKNKSAEIIIDSRHYIEKHYEDIERFSCELKYLKCFKNKGVLVPSLYKFDKKRKIIIIEKINGKVGSILNDGQIKLCIDVLFQMVFTLGLEKKNDKEINKYVSKVKSNITWWCKKNGYTIKDMQLKMLLQKLKKVCYMSFFQDAKPSNWIFQRDKIYAIDFDYVKKSFFLADLAQLLSYVSLKRKINHTAFINYYLEKILPKTKNYSKFYTPFKLALVNSNIASKMHRENLPLSEEKGFDKQNMIILKKLKII